jgi:hypothetical protein
VAFERIAEQKIREAMKEGAFDGLPRGKPIDLEEYFKLPVELRLGYSILKSAGFVPEEVEMLREVDRLQSLVDAAPDEAARSEARSALAHARLRLNLALERRRSGRE